MLFHIMANFSHIESLLYGFVENVLMTCLNKSLSDFINGS